jgi:hypothetical protein
MYFANQVPDFKDFKNIFPSRYASFFRKNRQEIIGIIEQIIDGELRARDEVEDLNNLVSEINDIETTFGLSLPASLGDVVDKMARLEDKPSTDDKLSYSSTYDKDASVSNIMGLFKEEMFLR